jgi:hypothetical protein
LFFVIYLAYYKSYKPKTIMKKLLLITVLALFATNTISAQDSKGYVGVSIGAALPQGDLRDETNTGLDFGFLNAGYRFDETWGATVNWGATGHAIKREVFDADDVTLGIGYFAVGPMISYGNFDFKPQYAFASATFKAGVSDIDVDVDSAWILGATYNFPLGGNWGMAANLDYFTFKLEDDDDSANMFKLSVGVQYKF